MNNVKTSKTYEMDMCNGPLLSKIVVFAIPLMLSGILQLLFNAADIVVVGRFAGKESLAAVGSTTSLINLLLNAFFGLSNCFTGWFLFLPVFLIIDEFRLRFVWIPRRNICGCILCCQWSNM